MAEKYMVTLVFSGCGANTRMFDDLVQAAAFAKKAKENTSIVKVIVYEMTPRHTGFSSIGPEESTVITEWHREENG